MQYTFQLTASLHFLGAEALGHVSAAIQSGKHGQSTSDSLKILHFQIGAELNKLASIAAAACDLNPLPSSRAGVGRGGRLSHYLNNPVGRGWLSEVSAALDKFTASKLPERKRLASAIGIAAYVPDRSAYRSITQPLIKAFLGLTDSLASQMRDEAQIIRFATFESIFSRNVKRVQDIHNLLDIGPDSTSVRFSQLINVSDISLLASSLAHEEVNPFRRLRIMKRIINKSKYKISRTFETSASCLERRDACECSGMLVKIEIPLPHSTQPCLSRAGVFEFDDLSTPGFFTQLASASDSLTLTTAQAAGSATTRAIKLLQPPNIRIHKELGGILVRGAGIFLPHGTKAKMIFSCFDENMNTSKTLKLGAYFSGLLRCPNNCDIKAEDGSLTVKWPGRMFRSSPTAVKLIQDIVYVDNISQSLFEPMGSWLHKDQLGGIIKGLESSLSAEDYLQGRIKTLESVSWLSWLMYHVMPAVGGGLAVILAGSGLYCLWPICCACLGCKGCKRSDTTLVLSQDESEVRERVKRLEDALALLVDTGFEKMSAKEIENKLKAKLDTNKSETEPSSLSAKSL